MSSRVTQSTTNPSRPNRARAVVSVLASRSVRDTQVALCVVRAVDLAQLVVISAFLFSRGGAALVATYGVVRTLGPAVGVPVVTALGCRLAHGALLRIMGTVATIGSIGMAIVAAAGGPTIAVLAGAGVVGIALGCFRPVISAVLPALVRSPEELVASNAATGFFDGASTLVGPVLGSIVGVVLGVPALLLATGGLTLAAGFIAGRLPMTTDIDEATGDPAGGGRLAEYVAGARELIANRGAGLVALLGTAQTFVRGATTVIVVVFAVDVLGTGDAGVGALYAAMGVGGLIGLPVAIGLADRTGMHRSLATGLATWGAPLAVCALLPTPGAALVLFGVIGIGNSLVDLTYYGAMQRVVGERVLARALGVGEALFQAGMASGALAGAVLVNHLGPRPSLFIVGLVLPGLAGLALSRLWYLDGVLRRRDRDIGLLRRLTGFARLPMTTLDHLADHMTTVEFAAGQVIMRTDDRRDAFVLIEEGAVEIAHDGGRYLAPPALLDEIPRAATVVARGAVSARLIARSTYRAAIQHETISSRPTYAANQMG